MCVCVCVCMVHMCLCEGVCKTKGVCVCKCACQLLDIHCVSNRNIDLGNATMCWDNGLHFHERQYSLACCIRTLLLGRVTSHISIMHSVTGVLLTPGTHVATCSHTMHVQAYSKIEIIELIGSYCIWERQSLSGTIFTGLSGLERDCIH